MLATRPNCFVFMSSELSENVFIRQHESLIYLLLSMIHFSYPFTHSLIMCYKFSFVDRRDKRSIFLPLIQTLDINTRLLKLPSSSLSHRVFLYRASHDYLNFIIGQTHRFRFFRNEYFFSVARKQHFSCLILVRSINFIKKYFWMSFDMTEMDNFGFGNNQKREKSEGEECSFEYSWIHWSHVLLRISPKFFHSLCVLQLK